MQIATGNKQGLAQGAAVRPLYPANHLGADFLWKTGIPRMTF